MCLCARLFVFVLMRVFVFVCVCDDVCLCVFVLCLMKMLSAYVVCMCMTHDQVRNCFRIMSHLACVKGLVATAVQRRPIRNTVCDAQAIGH